MSPFLHRSKRSSLNDDRPAFTLVETMIAFTVFSIVCLGAISLTSFSIKTMDNARTVTQVSKVLINEMEAMRMRGWNDRTITTENNKKITLYGLYSLGTGRRQSDNKPLQEITNDTEETDGVTTVKRTTAFNKLTYASTSYKVQPMAIYGAMNSTEKAAATLGKEIAMEMAPNLGQNTKYKITRTVTLKQSKPADITLIDTPEVDHAVITITAKWSDRRGNHQRSISTILSQNGLSDFQYRAIQ